MYDPQEKNTMLVHNFPVLPDTKQAAGNGLLGITLDPEFSKNHYIYFFYTPQDPPIRQVISRFTLTSSTTVDLSDEKVILQIPLDAEVSAHTGGSLAWDKDKNLFISVGDNTNPFESDGFAPIDERPGRLVFDAQRSSGNPNDLRGKILKIHPEETGDVPYSIPEGNLFPEGTPGTRPEIYVMGCRNPYRISVDPATGIVYWGEIGPDSGKDGVQGPMGYDELNQAKKPGNYGWPYFVGNNKPYNDYNFATKKAGDPFDPASPVNNSINNTGAKQLPPAQRAMIWYPYSKSSEFPQLGEGGRCIMGGPVYHYNSNLASNIKLPEYYDKALFIYDWMRNWVFAVRLDENQNYQYMEPFMPASGDFRRPVDMELGQDGALYVLEYGSVYGVDNEDARLVRIDYNAGNRAPIAKVTADDTVGTAPLTLTFSAKESKDLDSDPLTYSWKFLGSGGQATGEEVTYTFDRMGRHYAALTVTDPSGAIGTDSVEVIVGNTHPQVKITSANNKSFYFDNVPFQYAVEVKDKEEDKIDPQNLKITYNFIPDLKESDIKGHQQMDFNLGKSLMEGSDCKACHQIDKKAVGPAFIEVSKKYAGDEEAVGYLANKVITGGGGVWGEHAMNAHPQLSKENATAIVKYVLSLSIAEAEKTLPQTGAINFTEHLKSDKEGVYLVSAIYKDKGEGSVPLTGEDLLVLRPAKVQVENAELHQISAFPPLIGNIKHNAYFVLKNIDLTGIQNLTYRYASKDKEGSIEVHSGAPDSHLLSTVNFKATGDRTFKELAAPIKATDKPGDLYFVIKNEKQPDENLLVIDWVRFNRNANL